MNRLGLFILFLLLIGLIASFYTAPAALKLTTKVYVNTYSPYCLNWTGTSLLVKELRERGIGVIVVDRVERLRDRLNSSGLVLIVAPDTELDNETANTLYEAFATGRYSIAVFDENTTSNPLLEKLNISIDGRAVLSPTTSLHQFPYAVMHSVNGSVHRVRLNWASMIIRGNVTSNYSVREIAVTTGYLDVNDNGVLDSNDSFKGLVEVGVLIDNNESKVLVFADSFPLTNLAVGNNYTISRLSIEYLVELAEEKGGVVIIPNYVYTPRYVTHRIRYHIAFLFLYVADRISGLDQVFTALLYQNKYVLLLVVLASTLILAPLIRYVLKIKSSEDYRASEITSKEYLFKTLLVSELLDSSTLVGRRKTIVNNLWRMLIQAYRDVRGLDLSELISSENYEALKKLGFSDREVRELRWMYRVFLKVNKKSYLPVIVNWRRAVLNYVYLIEKYLNKLGYTVFGRRGFKSVSRLFA